MSARRAPKRAVWRRRRAWPWLLVAVALLTVVGWELLRIVRRGEAPAARDVEAASPPAIETPVVLAQGGETLEGTVLGADGKPVAGARVAVAASDAETAWTEACPGGETALLLCDQPASALRLVELLAVGPGAAVAIAETDAAGRFRLEHLRPGTYSVQGSAREGWADVERAPPGVPLRLVLRPFRSLQGRVLDEGGQPLAGARARLLPAGPGPVREAVSTADGEFRLDGATHGPFTLLVDAAGFLPAVVHPVSPGTATVRLARPRALAVHVAGTAPTALTARVRSVVRLLPGAGLPVTHLVREVEMKDGSARFQGLPPGEVEVEILGASVHGGPEPVQLRSPVTEVSLRLSPSAAATVAVVDAQGRPVQDCVLELRVPGGVPRKAPAASCEAVELEPVPPGEYLLSAAAPGFRRTERPVRLAAGPATLELVLDPGVALAGRVLDAAGFPVSGASLVVSPIGAVARSDGAGAFRVSVPGPGLYSVEAQNSELGGAERAVTAPDTDVVLRLQPRAVLELEVLAGGRPLEGALAVLFDVHDTGPGGQYQADRATGPDGRVRLLGFPPGTYTLGVMHPNAGSAPRQEVVLSEGSLRSVTVNLPAIPTGSLEGVVVDETGRAVEGASVSARPPDARPVPTDGEGRFRLVGLREGVEYQVSAVRGSSEPATARARSGESGVRLTLMPGRSYRGRVVDEAGRPIHAFRIGGIDVASDDGRFAVPLQPHGEFVAFTVEAAPLAAAVTRPANKLDLGDVVLRPPSRVQGVVREPDGRPVADALVICEGCRGEAWGVEGERVSVRTDATGRFTLPSITSATWVGLVAMKDARRAWGQAGRSGEEATLTLEDPVPVRGRVLGPNGVPLGGALVVMSEPVLEPLVLVTAADGTFSGEAPPGVYNVQVGPRPSAPLRTWTVRVPADLPLELRTGDAR